MQKHARTYVRLRDHITSARNSQVCANFAGNARYCAILCEVAARITQHHALARFVRQGPCVNVRGCNQCECSHRNQHVRLQRERTCTHVHARARPSCDCIMTKICSQCVTKTYVSACDWPRGMAGCRCRTHRVPSESQSMVLTSLLAWNSGPQSSDWKLSQW